MAELPKGLILNTTNCGTVKIIEFLGAGGQGSVYRVNYNGQEKALKWYHSSYLKSMDKNGDKINRKKFYENLKHNIQKGVPDKSFLWPQALTEESNDSFGYIMELRPKEYKELTDFLLLKTKFSSTIAMINAAINIIQGFYVLHNDGYSYQDLNNGGFFINPKNGNVLICDNDNVAGQGINFGISGKQRYMAPEVVLGGTPNKYSDRYSLAVVLFRMLFMEHPLEGKYSTPPCMIPEFERRFYGSDPVFIFDPKDKRNAASPNMQRNAYRLWPLFPEYIKELFITTFSKETIPEKRPIEKQWLDAFIRLRGETVLCDKCNEENFIDQHCVTKCRKCGNVIKYESILKFKKYNIPISSGAVISAAQIGDSHDLMGMYGYVIANPKNEKMIAIKNISENIWNVITPSGKSVQVKKNEIVPAINGLKIIINGHEGQIISKN